MLSWFLFGVPDNILVATRLILDFSSVGGNIGEFSLKNHVKSVHCHFYELLTSECKQPNSLEFLLFSSLTHLEGTKLGKSTLHLGQG